MKPGESSEIYNDPIYGKAKWFRLSTSNLFPGKFLVGTGFGAGVPDGYGMNYMLNKDCVKMGVESKHSCKETGTTLFMDTLTDVLRDMKSSFEGMHDSKL
jgi:carnitine O-acetyltransferase